MINMWYLNASSTSHLHQLLWFNNLYKLLIVQMHELLFAWTQVHENTIRCGRGGRFTKGSSLKWDDLTSLDHRESQRNTLEAGKNVSHIIFNIKYLNLNNRLNIENQLILYVWIQVCWIIRPESFIFFSYLCSVQIQ